MRQAMNPKARGRVGAGRPLGQSFLSPGTVDAEPHVRRWRMKSVLLNWRGTLLMPATLLVIGCERLPTSEGKSPGPRFSVVANITTLDLGTLGGNFSLPFPFVRSLNAAGQVVGQSTTATGAGHAFFWDGTTMRDLGTLGSNNSSAFALNDAGEVVGVSITATGAGHAFFWDGTTMRDLGTLGGNESGASAVNAAGQVVGGSTTASGAFHAYLWDGSMHDLGTLGGNGSNAQALNDAGQVVGASTTASGAAHAYLWDGSMRDLGTLGGNASGALAVNAAGQVAGGRTTASGDQHAAFWAGTTIRAPRTLEGNTIGASADNP